MVERLTWGVRVLSARAVVGGREIHVSMRVNSDTWDQMGPDFHEHCKESVRRKLMEEIFKVWTPVVKVH